MGSKVWLMFMLSALAMVADGSTSNGEGSSGHDLYYRGIIEDVESETLMDFEMNHRLLGERKYISYEALKANAVICNKPGHSYYYCSSGPATRANSYTRGCNAITRCQRYTG